MNESEIAKLKEKALFRYDFGDYGSQMKPELADDLLEAVKEIKALRSKLAITKDGFAVGLAEEVFYPESDGTVSCPVVLGCGGEFRAYRGDLQVSVEVSDCYASLETAHKEADRMKEKNDES